MRYLGWLIALLLAALGVAAYFVFYAPLEQGYRKQKDEIRMWTARVAALQGVPQDSITDTLPLDTTFHQASFGRLIATVPADSVFASVKTDEISAKGKAELTKLLTTLRASTGDVIVMVHTDNVRVDASLRNRFPTNWELSAYRAGAVVRYLLDQGIDSKRLVPCGMSAARPLADNSTPEGRARNRRVEIYLR